MGNFLQTAIRKAIYPFLFPKILHSPVLLLSALCMALPYMANAQHELTYDQTSDYRITVNYSGFFDDTYCACGTSRSLKGYSNGFGMV